MPKKVRSQEYLSPARQRQRDRENQKREQSLDQLREHIRKQLNTYAHSPELSLLLSELEQYQNEKRTKLSDVSRIMASIVLACVSVYLSRTEFAPQQSEKLAYVSFAMMLFFIFQQIRRYWNTNLEGSALLPEFNQFQFSPINTPLEDTRLYRLLVGLHESDDILNIIYQVAQEEGLFAQTEMSLEELLTDTDEDESGSDNSEAFPLEAWRDSDGEIRRSVR
jgi:hypothetical protein